MNKIVVGCLRGLMVACLLITLVALVWFVPWAATQMAREMPEFSGLRLPLLVLAELALVCAVVALVCLWQLLDRVGRGKIFDPHSLRWVQVMAGAAGVATLCCLLAQLWIPGPPLLGACVLVVALLCAGLALVLVVMRSLLVQASAFRAELDEVI